MRIDQERVASPISITTPQNGSTPQDQSPDVARRYEERAEAFQRQFADVSRGWNRVANFRLLAFITGAGLIVWGLWRDVPLLVLPGLLALVLFAWLIRHHQQLGHLRRRYGLLADINREAVARVRRDWAHLRLGDRWLPPISHPFARDLDLFGHGSLFHFLARTTTPMGSATLRDWLLQPASPDTIERRQHAIAELRHQPDARQELEVVGRQVESHPDLAPFLAWAEGPRWLDRRPALIWVARISVTVLWLLIGADLAGLIVPPLWLVPAVLNLLLAQTIAAPIYPILATVATQQRAMLRYADMLCVLLDMPLEARLTREWQASLTAGTGDAPATLRRLDRLASRLIPRGTLLYIPIQALTLWDIHLLAALERWQADAGQHARAWLTVLGEMEALSSLAGLAHDEPSWVFPDVREGMSSLDAEHLAHPLLPASRVANNVTIGPPGTFLLVTGSNMSGKSTLLRAIGTNAVLAGAGAPVCATVFSMPPVAIGTSARVQDSLTEGVSFFMAELQRLKQIVDLASETGQSGGQFLFLLDEILQGTNTAERQIAARQILKHLITADSIGAISTHDLELASTPALEAAAQPIHFRETFTGTGADARMSFDYRTRDGIATSSNALRLMALVGLGIGSQDETEGDEGP
ncbi:MAG: MutS-related protein [Thermomicrobiales bacterium]